MSFLTGVCLLIWVLVSFLANGIAALHLVTKQRGLSLICYGAAAGVLMNGLVGWAIAVFPAQRWLFVGALIALTLGSIIYLVLHGVPREVFLALSSPIRISLVFWALLLVAGLGIKHLKVDLPESLPDGLYIFKAPTTSVKLQHLAGLPPDNFIPFAVAEFFLRGVSFQNVRPILPGNEVSNRTILMSLVAMPFRAARGAPYDHPELGTYRYIGKEWPNVAVLARGKYYDQFFVVGLVLNSFLLLGVFLFCSSLGAVSALPATAILYVTNPYFLGQTIFTWPKGMAGFFILLAWTSMRSGHRPWVVAALMGLAYHSHPYALIFAGWIGLYYLWQWRREQGEWPAFIPYLLVFAVAVAPWFIWTRFVLAIPSNLVAQNVSPGGIEWAWASVPQFVWIRLQNLFCLFWSMAFAVYPFDYKVILNYWLGCLPGILGLVLIYPAFAKCADLPKPSPWVWYGVLGPALMVVALCGYPASPTLLAYQPILGVLLCLGVWWLTQHVTRTVCLTLLGLQLAMNIIFLVSRGILAGAHF